ncbi:UDP-glucuronosyltransferase 2A2-like [Babylonia areolata]|uniref:UDP-glucuronosyltransferase 2A2-like n=1 Tax=Babylonia areolata TaxID=304850 RepID=UPI003FD23AC2
MWPTAVTLTCLLTAASLAQVSDSKRVVSIPFPLCSHIKYYTQVAQVLASRGHRVWVAMPTYMLEKRYLDTSGFTPIPYDSLPGMEQNIEALINAAYFDKKPGDLLLALRLCRDIFDSILRNDSFIAAVGQTKPDLIVIDNLSQFYVVSIIPYRLGVPFAFLGAFYSPHLMGVPFSPASTPHFLLPYSDTMTFFQRLYTTVTYIVLTIIDPTFPTEAVSMYAPEMPYLPLSALVAKTEIFLVERDHVLDYPQPTLPNVKLIGGTATGPAKVLPPEYRSFMDSGKEGVVIVSFGSYVLGLSKHISDKVLQVLLQLPMKSIFRSNLTSPDPTKILTAPWIPQNDLLGHPHTKVFVSHCGQNGQYEALYHAVPIVAMPLFYDQHYNAERVRVKGFAEVLDLKACTAEELMSTILTVANEPRYKQAVAKRSRLFRELYGVPTETAAYWLDHVMEYGGDYMRSAGQQMPFYQYVLLDVFIFILCVAALVVVVIYCLISAISRRFQKKKSKAE